MKALIYISIFLLSLKCFAQSETKEAFLNEVYKVFVDSSFRFYYLSRNASHFTNRMNWLQMQLYPRLKKELGKLDTLRIAQIVKNAEIDTLELKWDCNGLNLARCVNEDSMHDAVFDCCYLVHKKSKKRAEYILNNKSPEERVLYIFSRPIFDNNEDYAIIYFEEFCGALCASGCIDVFNKINGHWIKIAEIFMYEA